MLFLSSIAIFFSALAFNFPNSPFLILMMQLNGKVKYLFLIISSLNPINVFIKKPF